MIAKFIFKRLVWFQDRNALCHSSLCPQCLHHHSLLCSYFSISLSLSIDVFGVPLISTFPARAKSLTFSDRVPSLACILGLSSPNNQDPWLPSNIAPHAMMSPHRQWRKQLLRIFGPELVRINELIKTARSAVKKTARSAVFFCFAASAAKFRKHDFSSASEKAFLGGLGDIFGCSIPSKKRRFSIEQFTRFLSTVSSQRRATRSDVSFQTK